MPNRRKKVLVEAYECSPVRAHAPGSAWQIISRVAKWHDLWVIVEETQYKTEIVKYQRENHNAGNINFVFVPRLSNEDYGAGRPVLPFHDILLQKLWLRRSLKCARELHRSFCFDVVHHLRRHSFREPGYLWRLNVPFVWGPTGGGDILPLCTMRALDLRYRLLYSLKNIINTLQFRYSAGVRRAVRNSHTIIAQTSESRRRFLRLKPQSVIIGQEMACDPPSGMVRTYRAGQPLRVVWAGRFIALKALPILLQAISLLPRGQVVLHIAGDGPCRDRWMAMARSFNVMECCVWHGWLSQQKTMEVLKSSDVLAFTSLAEGTPATVTQALSMGLPIICLNHCGYGDIVDSTCGIPVAVSDYRSIVNGFAQAMKRIIDYPDILSGMSIGANQKAASLSWDCLAHAIGDIYESIDHP